MTPSAILRIKFLLSINLLTFSKIKIAAIKLIVKKPKLNLEKSNGEK